MAEVTLRWPTARSTPIHPEWEEHTYSGGRAAAEAIVALGYDVWVNGARVTPEDAQRDLDIRARVRAERDARAVELAAERKRLTQARREAVAVELTRGTYGIKTDEEARQFMSRFQILELVAYERADRVIAAYEGVR